MLQILKLLIPALVPSWNFFDVITPSPRIQFALLHSEKCQAVNDAPIIWREFRPRPTHLSFIQMLKRMLWNAHWNETMYVVGCAERLMVNPTPHSENEILSRITNDLSNKSSKIYLGKATHLQFRLVFIERYGDKLLQEVSYHSRVQALPKINSADRDSI